MNGGLMRAHARHLDRNRGRPDLGEARFPAAHRLGMLRMPTPAAQVLGGLGPAGEVECQARLGQTARDDVAALQDQLGAPTYFALESMSKLACGPVKGLETASVAF